ncbi:respiratory nitrate reductase subunit gamma [Peptococcus simiae]|uniref:respiratory nitrate reductase subunit gamma n=1 Tax=Peptococcus simiae TaxID=1643805 RepID=UPI00397FC3D2
MLLTLFCWFAIIFFIAASVKKFRYYANKPMHGRQDLYPIPGEDPDRVEYGGSFYEEQRWYEKSRKKNHRGEIIDMLAEMLFIKKLFQKQTKLWWVSYSLHLGIYCIIAAMVIGAAAVLLPFTGILATLLGLALTVAGLAGAILMTIGTIGLLVKRIVDHEFRNYTTPQEYFNLAFLCAGSATGLAAFISNGCRFGYVKSIFSDMFHFRSIKGLNKITIVHVLIFCGLLIYIPLTKMSHYAGKFFAFHSVLWDNRPNLPGSKVEQQIMEEASIKPSPDMQWSAPHYHPAPEGDDKK